MTRARIGSANAPSQSEGRPAPNPTEPNPSRPRHRSTSATNPGTNIRAFAAHEFVRVVPLHYPKPMLSIDELARQKRRLHGG